MARTCASGLTLLVLISVVSAAPKIHDETRAPGDALACRAVGGCDAEWIAYEAIPPMLSLPPVVFYFSRQWFRVDVAFDLLPDPIISPPGLPRNPRRFNHRLVVLSDQKYRKLVSFTRMQVCAHAVSREILGGLAVLEHNAEHDDILCAMPRNVACRYLKGVYFGPEFMWTATELDSIRGSAAEVGCQLNGGAKADSMNEVEPYPGEIQEAKSHPNGWVYRIAGRFGPNDGVPPEAIVGAWKVDAGGRIVGHFIENKKYDPVRWPKLIKNP